MLLAKFTATGDAGARVDVTVSSFPGDVGGLPANVNRWRGQVGLPPIQAGEIAAQTTTVDLSGIQGTVVDVTGTDAKNHQPARLIGVVVPRGGQTWFYKLMGNPAVADREKAAFLDFVKSAKYSNAP
ncbi:MAG TPA: hypothetical protein DCM86_08100 [Verrucomicrobiales bacterium]|nr:hypothetical protein [Verrucomicrobiales bacterium]